MSSLKPMSLTRFRKLLASLVREAVARPGKVAVLVEDEYGALHEVQTVSYQKVEEYVWRKGRPVKYINQLCIVLKE